MANGRESRSYLLAEERSRLAGEDVPVHGFSRGGIPVAGFLSFLHLLKSRFSVY